MIAIYTYCIKYMYESHVGVYDLHALIYGHFSIVLTSKHKRDKNSRKYIWTDIESQGNFNKWKMHDCVFVLFISYL